MVSAFGINGHSAAAVARDAKAVTALITPSAQYTRAQIVAIPITW